MTGTRSPAFFDFDGEYGKQYDRVIRVVVPGYDDLHKVVLAVMRLKLGAEADVLVVGAGTGVELVTFATHEPSWSITGVEPAPQMAEQARAAVEHHGLTERVRIIQGFTASLPETNAFDGASMIFVLHFVPDDGAKLRLLRDIAERMKPGGVLALVDINGDPDRPADQNLFAAWMRYVRYRGLTEDEQEHYRRQVDGTVHFATESRLMSLLAEAGFGDPLRFCSSFLFGAWLVRKTG